MCNLIPLSLSEECPLKLVQVQINRRRINQAHHVTGSPKGQAISDLLQQKEKSLGKDTYRTTVLLASDSEERFIRETPG